jgi:hypothetical protein
MFESILLEFVHSVAFSMQGNYTDLSVTTCRQDNCKLFEVDIGVQQISFPVNLHFLDLSCYFFIQIAPQLPSWGQVDPVPDQLLLRKSGSTRNRTQNSWICSQGLWPLGHRGGWNLITSLWYIFCQICNSNFNIKTTRSCMYFYLTSLTLCTFNDWKISFPTYSKCCELLQANQHCHPSLSLYIYIYI